METCTWRLRASEHERDEARGTGRYAVGAGREVGGVQVFLNDYWQLALEAGAYGVHLGQEDLDTADLAALRSAGIRLGLQMLTIFWLVACAFYTVQILWGL